MRALLFLLLAWIGDNTSYPVPQTLPLVEYRSERELWRMYFCESQASCKDENLPAIRIAAVFDGETNVMYLNDGFDPERREDRGTVVHELVHYLQGLAEKHKIVCHGLLENEAYLIEDQWREEHGLEPRELTPSLIMARSCPPGPT